MAQTAAPVPPSTTKPGSPKAAGTRSPSFITASFPQALEMGQKVYEANHRHPVSDEAIALALGAKSLNGTSSSKIATLKKFGILESSGNGTRVSENAYTLYELGPDTDEGANAARSLAMRPAAFQLLKSQYGDRLPSDASIRVFLFGKGYQKETAEQLIRHYRDTITWVETKLPKDAAPIETAPKPASNPAVRSTAIPVVQSEVAAEPESRPDQTRLQFKIAQNTDAVVVFTGMVTQRAILKLITLLEASADVFPEDALPTTAQVANSPTLLSEQDEDEETSLFDEDDEASYEDDTQE